MRSIAAYIATMDDARSFTYNSNHKSRCGTGYFCDIQAKQKIVETIPRVPLGGFVSRCARIRAETKAVNVSAFRLFCVDVRETAKAERSTKTETNAESVAHRLRFWRVTF